MTADNSKPAEIPDEQGPITDVPRPRLQIWHIMLLTATTALVFAIYAAHFRELPSYITEFEVSPFRRAVVVVYRMIQGASVAGGILVLWYWRRLRFRSQPGERLLMVMGLYFLTVSLIAVLMLSLDAWDLAILQTQLLDFSKGLLFLAVGISRGLEARWRAFFCLVALQQFVDSLMALPTTTWLSLTMGWQNYWVLTSIYAYTRLLLSVMTLAALLLAVWVDWRRGLWFSWLHWCGVVLFVGSESWDVYLYLRNGTIWLIEIVSS